MLNTQKLGVTIALLRKKTGYSQEKLGYMLHISPQAISKWENGHTLPETSLLPVLAQIFNCTIDEIIMPSYSFDEKIEEEKMNAVEQQAEYIANHVIKKLEEKNMTQNIIGLDNDMITNAVKMIHPDIGVCEIKKSNITKLGRYTCVNVTVSAPQKELKLIEKIFNEEDAELHRYGFINYYTLTVPQIYHIDFDRKIILMEDLNVNYIQCYDFNEENENGDFIRKNHNALISTTAKFHAAFWENYGAFEKIGLDWRLENKENLLAHINGMEKDYKRYRTNEENGKIPKVWNTFENNIDLGKLNYFQSAIDILREKYVGLLETRFHKGNGITIIHGDLHPGNIFISKTSKAVKMIDMQAVRMGVCTEDLAMLLALHIEPDKKTVMPLLEHYYNCLCETVKDYPFEMLLEDYKISIMENMFFTIRHINHKIYDFSMRDKAMRAFETFVLDME